MWGWKGDMLGNFWLCSDWTSVCMKKFFRLCRMMYHCQEIVVMPLVFFQLTSSEISHMCSCTLFHMVWWWASSNTTVWHPETWANKRHALTTWLASAHGVLVLWGRIVGTKSPWVFGVITGHCKGVWNMLVRRLGHLCCFVSPPKNGEMYETPRNTLLTLIWALL